MNIVFAQIIVLIRSYLLNVRSMREKNIWRAEADSMHGGGQYIKSCVNYSFNYSLFYWQAEIIMVAMAILDPLCISTIKVGKGKIIITF